MFSWDQSSDDIPVSSVTLKDSILSRNISAIGGSYEGKLDAHAHLPLRSWARMESAKRDTKMAIWRAILVINSTEIWCELNWRAHNSATAIFPLYAGQQELGRTGLGAKVAVGIASTNEKS